MRGMRGTGLLLAIALLAAGCSDGGDDGSDGTADAGATATTTVEAAQPPGTGTCDPSDPSACLLPWPNDRFTRADPTTDTGRRVDLPAEGMPANAAGTRIDPAEWNRNDGFSPTSTLLALIEDLDLEASGLAPVTDIERSLDPESPLVLLDLDADGGPARLAAWAELDANTPEPAPPPLMIVPAAGLPEGHRIAVGLRGLVRTDGSEVEPSEGFAAELEDPSPSLDAALEALDEAGVAAEELDLAWTFTVGSTRSITGRMRHLWAETKGLLDGGAPEFTVTSEEPSGGAQVVRGELTMPKFLTGDGGPGTVLANGDDPEGLPEADGTMQAPYTCLVPSSATADEPAGSVVYGHGLLGGQGEVLGIGQLGAGVGLSFCAVDWIGMSAADVPAIIDAFDDLTAFRTLPDRLQQGHLSMLLLGRLLADPDGFASHGAFQDDEGRPLLDVERVSFLGASQGGILGGVPSALTEDWERVVLAVPGMGYNVLLRRSVNFDRFLPLVEESYQDPLDQVLLIDLLQQLWDRGENAGYASHLTADTLDGVPAKQVLLLEAFGDHQVANVATQKLARTLGVPLRAPALADGRSPDVTPYWGIEPIESYPHDGSGLVVWDFGTDAPPTENVPNRAGEDPHGKLAEVPQALALLLAFVDDGQLVDVCGGEPCRSAG